MLKVSNISYDVGNREILSDVSFALNLHERIGLVGANGAGKTTLLKIVAGLIKPTAGRINEENSIINYFPQEITDGEGINISEYIEQKAGEVEKYMIEEALAKVDLAGFALTAKVESLSGGEKTKLSLAAIMLSQSDIILLDEPTNNLDLEGLEILENFILKNRRTLIFVSHDRRFLKRVATKILALNEKDGTAKEYRLGYDEYMEAREREKEKIKDEYERYWEDKKALDKAYHEKLDNSQRAERARNKDDNEKLAFHYAKEKATKKLSTGAKAMKSRISKMEEPPKPEKELDLNFLFGASSEHLGDMVARLDGVVVDFGGKQIGPINFEFRRNDRMAIIGKNGIGKTTLFRLLTDQIKPASGEIRIGQGVKFGLIDQNQTLPEPEKDVLTNFRILAGHEHDLSRETEGRLRQVLARFNFNEKINSKDSQLSPGERSRLLLAALSVAGSNVLLFDEPTNHLDIEAAEEVETALSEFKGTFAVITHDREFLDKIKPNKKIEFDKL